MDMKIRYATIIVKDMAESIKFYSELMGFEIDSQFIPKPGIEITLMKSARHIVITTCLALGQFIFPLHFHDGGIIGL